MKAAIWLRFKKNLELQQKEIWKMFGGEFSISNQQTRTNETLNISTTRNAHPQLLWVDATFWDIITFTWNN